MDKIYNEKIKITIPSEYKLLIVDDEQPFVDSASKTFSAKFGINVIGAYNGEDAIEIIKKDPYIWAILLDNKLPGISGLESLKRINKIRPNIKVIILTAHGDTEIAVQSMYFGAFYYLDKPLQFLRCMALLDKAWEVYRLELEAQQWRKQVLELWKEQKVIGQSPLILELLEIIGKVASTSATVLILGEPGVGKELVAKVIHNLSPRNNYPLVIVNCSAVPESIFESELFGHEKGAFTGAQATRIGAFESAKNGTLFLDEIGDLTESTQGKLLRAIQESVIKRVGSSSEISVDVRIVAATNKDLEDLVSKGKFRQDLFDRLNVFPIQVPPLRERKEDIPLLCQYFILKYSKEYQKKCKVISNKSLKIFKQYDWPGNVRELENVINSIIIMLEGEEILPENLPSKFNKSILSQQKEDLPFYQALESFVINYLFSSTKDESGFVKNFSISSDWSATQAAIKRSLIRAAVVVANGNQNKAAEILGCDPATVSRVLKGKYDD